MRKQQPTRWVGYKRWLVALLGMAALLLALKPVGEQWVTLGPYSGGINIESDGRFLGANQLYTAENFIWTVNGLAVREGFQRFAAPLSANPINFMTIFRNNTGQKYLFSSDGISLWCRRNLTEAATLINYGRLSRGCANTYAGSKIVDMDTVAVAQMRTMIGTAEGWTIRVGDTTRIIDYVLCDSLLYVTVPFSSTMVRQPYLIEVKGIEIRQAFPMVNNLWFYTNTGKFSFTRLDSIDISNALTGDRWLMTTPYVTRNCWNSRAPTLRFKSTGFSSGNQANKFLRLTTDPRSNVANNPIPAGHHFYMSYPIQASQSGFVYTSGAAFMPDSAGSGAEYFIIEDLKYDSTSLTFVTVDSIQSDFQDSSQWSCGPSKPVYQKIWLRSMPDSMAYGTGDWFMSPSITATNIGHPTASGATYASVVNVIRGSKFTTPNKQAVKVSGMTFKCYAAALSGVSVKGAVYTAAKVLVDTTLTYKFPSSPTQQNAAPLTFVEPADLVGNTDYFFVVWCDQVGGYAFNLLRNMLGGYHFWSQSKTFNGSFPTTFAPTESLSYQACVDIGIVYFDSTLRNNRTTSSCYPVVGGYVTGDSAILAGADAGEFHDHDTCRIAMFRMKRNLINPETGINFAVVNNSNNTVLESRLSNPSLIYYSEPNEPANFLANHVVTIDPGNPCVIGGEQAGNMIIYTASNRFQLVYAGGGAYAKNRMDGSRGIIAKGSFVNVDGVHYGLARDGYWQSDGGAPEIISNAVASYFRDSLDYSQLEKIASGYDPTNDNIWITFNGITLVYNRPTGSWWRQSFAASAYAYNGDITISDSITFMAAGAESSTIYIQKGNKDDGVNLTASLQTGYMNFDAPEIEKGIVDLRLGYKASDTTSGSITMHPVLSVDGTLYKSSSNLAMTIASGANDKWIRLPMGSLWGNEVGLGINVTNGSGLRWNYVRAKVMSGGER